MNFKSGDIVTIIKDFIVPSSGITFYYYRGSKYKIERLDWGEDVYITALISGKGCEFGFFSVKELNDHFHNIKWIRKEKIKRIDELYNTR
jgi:hypothetical protein